MLRISSTAEVHTKKFERSFHPSMRLLILALSSSTDVKTPATDSLALDDAEPDLDKVHPGRVGRGEMHDGPRVGREPRADGSCFGAG